MRNIETRLLLCIALILFVFCPVGCTKKERSVRVGIDPEWSLLRLTGREGQLFAFSMELLKEIGKSEGIVFEQICRGGENLLEGLKEEGYQAVVSSLRPYLFREKEYQFSELYLATGPVLVVKKESAQWKNGDFLGKEIGIDSQSNEVLLAQNYWGAVPRYYGNPPELVNALLNEEIDGALINQVIARRFLDQIHPSELAIWSPPLNDAGLRFITLPKNRQLVDLFNRGLERAKEGGTYQQLLKKWNLE